jgi:hypothetical protein
MLCRLKSRPISMKFPPLICTCEVDEKIGMPEGGRMMEGGKQSAVLKSKLCVCRACAAHCCRGCLFPALKAKNTQTVLPAGAMIRMAQVNFAGNHPQFPPLRAVKIPAQ